MTPQRIGNFVIAASPEMLRPFWLKLRASPIGVRLVRGAFWSVAGTMVSRALGLLASIALARILGRTAFGELGTIQSTAGLFGIFAGLGLGITATKYVAELRDTHEQRCGRVIGFCLTTAMAGGTAAGLGLLIFAKWLAAHTLAAPQLAGALRWSALLVLLSTVQGAYQGALAGFEAFKGTASISFYSGLLSVPLIVVGGWLAGVEGAVGGLILQALAACVLSHAMLRKEMARARIPLSFAVHMAEWRLLWRFTVPAFLSGMAATPASWFSRTLLVNQPGGYPEMAMVSAANQWMNLLTFIPYMLGSVLVPVFANLHATGKQKEFRRLLGYNLVLNASVTSALALPIMLCAPIILGFYGPGFRDGVMIFWISMIVAIITAVNNLFSRAMQSAGKAWIDLSSSVLWAMSVVAGGWFLIRPCKGIGLVVTMALAAFALAIWQWFLLQKVFLKMNGAAHGG
ncbi:MAG TPA: oligosaccharide flippase family protein [Verrucomicrobiae bacterium]|nr:oligosaccharide flippase family protein [Verrucomicrobiae bacterium]